VILLEQAGARFNMRVAGVAYRDGQVLLQRVEGEDHWFLPGGRVEMLESAEEGLMREIREELGCESRVDRLLWVVENFFPMGGFRYHELGLYFLVELPTSLPFGEEFPGHETHLPLFNRWFALDGLPSIKPSFLCATLPDPPATAGHIIHRD
jgi:ADP-ribose pyrophosphatase YjhB (NUDIX family)